MTHKNPKARKRERIHCYIRLDYLISRREGEKRREKLHFFTERKKSTSIRRIDIDLDSRTETLLTRRRVKWAEMGLNYFASFKSDHFFNIEKSDPWVFLLLLRVFFFV